MNLSHTLGGCANIVHGKEFPMNSVILKLDNGIELVCASFQQSRKKPIIIFVYLPNEKKWKKVCTKNAYTEMMWDYYKKNKTQEKIML